jgi:hypothetical protein
MNIQNLIYQVSHDGYIEKLLGYMDDIEYRRVSSQEDLNSVEKIRQAAYKKAGSFTNPNHPATDAADFDPNVFVFAVYWREKLVSTVRVHILNSKSSYGNSLSYFPDVVGPLLEQGKTFMDPTRFVIDPALEDDISGLSMITLRLGFVAAKYFDCDYCLSMIRPKHSAFYRRVFRSTQITPNTTFKTLSDPYALHSSPKSMEEAICSKYPIFRSLVKERELLFSKPKYGQPANLSVKPTARLANQLLEQVRYEMVAS